MDKCNKCGGEGKAVGEVIQCKDCDNIMQSLMVDESKLRRISEVTEMIDQKLERTIEKDIVRACEPLINYLKKNMTSCPGLMTFHGTLLNTRPISSPSIHSDFITWVKMLVKQSYVNEFVDKNEPKFPKEKE